MNRRTAYLVVLLALLSAHPASAQLPEGLTKTKLSTPLLKEVTSLLPEGKKLKNSNPRFLAPDISPNLKLTQETEVKIIFLDEGAGYKNAVGYFTFDETGKVLATKVIFANASEKGGGGDLLPGDTLSLGTFPAGTNLGFYLIADGYTRKQKLPAEAPADKVFYSVDALNKAKDRHVALVATKNTLKDGSQPFLMGFEDLALGVGDEDYNDCMFMVQVSQSAMRDVIDRGKIPVSDLVTDKDGDGIDDLRDQFPDDPKRAFSVRFPEDGSYYFITFEDIFPYVGDGDYNDLVVAFGFERVTDAKNKVVELRMRHQAVARGAKYRHEFHHRLRWPGAKATSVLRRFDAMGKAIAEVRTDHTSGGADLLIFPDSQVTISDPKSPRNFANTEAGQPQVTGGYTEVTLTFDEAVNPMAMEDMPFDPYLLVLDTGFDIHMVGKAPLMDTKNPDNKAGRTFIDDNQFPFSMLVPASWAYPEETNHIDKAYPKFKEFRDTKGAKQLDWYRFPGTGVRTYKFN